MDTAALQHLLALASRQFGVFSTAQARNCGCSPDSLRSWAQSGRLVRIGRGIWSIAGVAPRPEHIAQSALLAHGHGAALCRTSAGWAWDVPGHLLEPVQVLRDRSEHRRSLGAGHTSRALDPDDVTERRGLRLTTPTRTIFDLAGQQHPDRTARDLNSLMSRGLVTLQQLDAGLARLAKRGRPGITTMRALIAKAREMGVPAGSNLELRVQELLMIAGLRTMRRQVEIHDDDGLVARVDFGAPELRIAVEVDSDRFHHGLVDRQADALKTRRLQELGWLVVRITEWEIFHGRTELVERLRRVAAGARAARAAEAA